MKIIIIIIKSMKYLMSTTKGHVLRISQADGANLVKNKWSVNLSHGIRNYDNKKKSTWTFDDF